MFLKQRGPNRPERLARVGFDLASFELERIERCDLCSSQIFIQIGRHDRYGIPIRSQLCGACGLVFLSPRPTPRGYDDFYQRYYRLLVAAFADKKVDPRTLERQQDVYARSLDEHLLGPFLRDRRGGRLLDVGASTGSVAHYFVERYGFEATCVEPSSAEAGEARRRGLETFVGFAEDYDPGDLRFDVVLLCKTIDHLLAPTTVLQRIHDWLADDGLFFVDPVDFRALCRKFHRLDTVLKIDHPYNLTRETMDLYLRKVGFEPLAIDASGNVFHLDYLCRKTAPAGPRRQLDFADELFREIRWLQATYRPGMEGDRRRPRELLRRRWS